MSQPHGRDGAVAALRGAALLSDIPLQEQLNLIVGLEAVHCQGLVHDAQKSIVILEEFVRQSDRNLRIIAVKNRLDGLVDLFGDERNLLVASFVMTDLLAVQFTGDGWLPVVEDSLIASLQ